MNSTVLTVSDLRLNRIQYSRTAAAQALALPFHIEIPVGRLAVFAALSLADLLLTWVLLRNTGGIVYESNPLANLMLMNYGWAGMVIFKFTDMLVVTSVSLVLCFFQPRIGRRVLTLAC